MDEVKVQGVSISKYIKDRIIPKDDSFEKIWREFSSRFEKFPCDVTFTVAEIMTWERWSMLDRSTKLSLGKLFIKKIKDGEIRNVVFVGRSSSNVSIYKKIK